MTTQQLERDLYTPPPVVTSSCIECGGACLMTERLCFRCQLMMEDVEDEHA